MTQHKFSLGNKINYEIIAEIPTLSDLRLIWKNIPDVNYQNLICRENQYYLLHKEISLNTMYVHSSGDRRNILGDLRTGMRFPLLVIVTQIAEAALLSHGIKRKMFTRREANHLHFERLLIKWSSEIEYKNFSKLFDKILKLRHCIHASRKTRKYKKLVDALGTNYYSTLVSLDSLIAEMRKIK